MAGHRWHGDCYPSDEVNIKENMRNLIAQPTFWTMKWRIGLLTLATFVALC